MADNQQLDSYKQFKAQLVPFRDEVKKLLPTHITVDKFERVTLMAVMTNPYLLTLDRASLFNACLKCATEGLIPDGREAALVPHKDKVTFMPMYYGILKKIRNTGETKAFVSNVVYANEKFKHYFDDEGEHLMHEPISFGDKGEPIGVYALVVFKDGTKKVETLDKKTLQQIENMALEKLKDKSKSPWKSVFYLEMWRKSAIRRLGKTTPMSSDVERLIFANDEDLAGDLEDAPPRISKAEETQKLLQAAKQAEVIEQPTPIEDEVPQPKAQEEQGAFADFNKTQPSRIEAKS